MIQPLSVCSPILLSFLSCLSPFLPPDVFIFSASFYLFPFLGKCF